MIAERDLGTTEVKVTEGVFTFVALDAQNHPRPVDPPADATSAETGVSPVG